MDFNTKKVSFLFSSVLMLSVMNSAVVQAKARSCDELSSAVKQANKDYQALLNLGPELENSDCPGGYLNKVRLRTTSLIAKHATGLIQSEHMQSANKLLDQAPSLTWYVAALRGDVHAHGKNWKQAMEHYNLAYDLAEDDNPQKPLFFKKASEALVLHGSMATVVERSSEGSGILGSRGPKPEFFPVPIQFTFGQATISEQGAVNAQALVKYLESKTGITLITLVGHTDPVGSDGANLHLSQRRAKALKQLLKNKGITVPIVTTGKGESSAPDLSDPSQYTVDEYNALARRVEFKAE